MVQCYYYIGSIAAQAGVSEMKAAYRVTGRRDVSIYGT
jgi:hypothetical protein